MLRRSELQRRSERVEESCVRRGFFRPNETYGYILCLNLRRNRSGDLICDDTM
jgi:hypothetical protein